MTHESYQCQTTKSEDSMRLSISRGLLEGHPSPGMWPLSPTPNLLSKCHQVLAKDKGKGKGHRESLCIHLPLSAPWIDYSGLIRPVYLLPCRSGQMKKRRRRGIISFYTMQEGLRQPSKGADVYTHMQAITVEGLMPRVKKKENCKRMRKGWALCVTKWFLSSSLRNLTKEFWSSLCLLPGGVILDASSSRSPKYPAPHPSLIPFLSSCPLPRVSLFLTKAFITKRHLIIIARCVPDTGAPLSAGISFNTSPVP